jgi:hypothetical protein
MSFENRMTTNSRTMAVCSDGQNERTIPGSLRSVVSNETASRSHCAFGDHLRAVVLTGSLARGEETVELEADFKRVLGDAEFLLIFHEGVGLPNSTAIQALQEDVEQAVKRHQIRCKVGFGAVHPAYLQRLPKHVFSYELRNNGRVVWGDLAILSQIPAFHSQDILREDAWQMLGNRSIELLENPADFGRESIDRTGPLHYRTVKLYLDMATSLLIFARAYAPSYRERERNLRHLASESTDPSKWPFDLRSFAEQVSACTARKLSEARAQGDPLHISWENAVRCAGQLWRWELKQLTRAGEQNSISDREMLFRLVRLQSPAKRLRGWIYVLRKCGWHRSWRNWPRWMRLAWRASPRYWVYAASNELLARLPALLSVACGLEEVDSGVRELWGCLPVVRRSQSRGTAAEWQAIATEISWNYHEFLEHTRA